VEAAANGLANLSVVNLHNDKQYLALLKSLMPDSARVYLHKPDGVDAGVGGEHLNSTERRGRTDSASGDDCDEHSQSDFDVGDRPEIAWLPIAVWVSSVGCMLAAPLWRVVWGDNFFHYPVENMDPVALTFVQTRFVLLFLLTILYGLKGAVSLRKTLQLLYRIRRVVEAAVSVDIHVNEWQLPYSVEGAAEWSARLLFASRFVSAQFTGPVAGFVFAWLLGSLIAAVGLAILVLASVDWPHALTAVEFYAFCAVLFVYVLQGLAMLWQLLQTDDIIFGSIRDVSVLSVRGSVVNTYRSLMSEYTNSVGSLRSGGEAAPPPSLRGEKDPAILEHLRAASFAQLLAMTWQQRYSGVQIMAIEGLPFSRITISKASFRALVVGAIVSGASTVGRLVYAQLFQPN
jgi:hypothetical protein